MILPYAVAILLWLAIIIYASLEGADFGGGLWDFLAFGSQKDEMRALIKNAIAPVWEANNVWLTYLIVGLLTAFPIVAQLLTTALFIPLVLILIAIVLRGATFIFRSFSSNALQPIWGRIFSISSIITPFLFGTMAAAVASGALGIVHWADARWTHWRMAHAFCSRGWTDGYCTLQRFQRSISPSRLRQDTSQSWWRTFVGVHC